MDEILDLDDYLASVRSCRAQEAKQLRFLDKLAAADEADGDGEFTHLEVAALSGVSERFARNRIELARTLVARLPRTLEALEEGRIDEYRARRMAQGTDVLSDENAGQVEETLIPQIDQWNPRQLNDRLRRAVHRADPAAAAARAEVQRAARHVRHDALDDGAGLLQIQGDGERTHLAYQRLQTIARDIKTAGDDRTLDQITADVALDCLAGKEFEQAKVQVWLTLPATTALGVDEAPAHLAGYGLLPAQRALTLAAQQDATWHRVLTDPTTGQAVDVGRRTYRPPAALRDHLRVRFPTCIAPGCRRPAYRCDLDHGVPFPAGATDQDNVRPLCRRHHRTKTLGAARIEGATWITKRGYRFPYQPEQIAEPVKARSCEPATPRPATRTGRSA
nr:HNH endonuclease [uncultured bacterium]